MQFWLTVKSVNVLLALILFAVMSAWPYGIILDSKKVETADGASCHGSTKLPLPLPSGFLLGPVASPGLGALSSGCSRVISATDGQRVNITLYDFGMMHGQQTAAAGPPSHLLPPPPPSTAHPGASQVGLPPPQTVDHTDLVSTTACRRLALVTDVVAGTAVDVCASAEGRRMTHAYLSVGALVEIRLLRDGLGGVGLQSTGGVGYGRHFMLRYNVTGCPDVKLPPAIYWIKRADSEATVGCQATTRTWRLVCRGTAWSGDVGNCTDDVIAKLAMTSAAYHVRDDVDDNDDVALDLTSSLPTGLAAIIIVVIAVSVGLCVAAVGILTIRRHRKATLQLPSPTSLVHQQPDESTLRFTADDPSLAAASGLRYADYSVPPPINNQQPSDGAGPAPRAGSTSSTLIYGTTGRPAGSGCPSHHPLRLQQVVVCGGVPQGEGIYRERAAGYACKYSTFLGDATSTRRAAGNAELVAAAAATGTSPPSRTDQTDDGSRQTQQVVSL